MIQEWLDKNDLIKPQKAWEDSGNGVLYSAIWLILKKETGDFAWKDRVEKAILACLKDGLLHRTPTNDFGQEQWDNHLGLGAYSYFYKNTSAPRSVIKRAWKNLFMFDTDGKKEGKDFLGRFPQIWAVYFVAAFPALKWLAFIKALLISRFMKPHINDASGTQLAWLYLKVMNDAFPFGFKKSFQEVNAQMKKTAPTYYGGGHPIVEMVGKTTS
jgi:hypothetical protein